MAGTLAACLVLPLGTGQPALADTPAPLDTSQPATASEQQRPRTIITQDGEIDDMASMVRSLYYANEFDIEGIIYSSSMFHWRGEDPDAPPDIINEDGVAVGQCGGGFSGNQSCTAPFRWTGTQWYEDYLDAYEEIYPNLSVHAEGYPTPDELRGVSKMGNVDYSSAMSKDTEGSEWIKQIILDDDPRPVYVQTWGGLNTLARALKSIEDDYTAQGAEALAAVQQKVSDKVIIYNILNQDTTLAGYIRPNWPGIQVIDNQSQFWSFAYRWANTVPQPYQYTLKSEWIVENLIREHGPLLERYHTWGDGQVIEGELPGEDRWSLDKGQFPNSGRTQYDFISEGDSPAFMFLFNYNGLRSAEDPTWGGWGGRFAETETGWIDTTDHNTFTGASDRSFPQTRWVEDIQNDFAARADWGVTPNYEDANHNPQASVFEGLDLERRPGTAVTLTGSATDPDGDDVSFRWWQYEEPGTYPGTVTLAGANTSTATFILPQEAPLGSTIHMILEVTDNGTPALKHYQRVVVTVSEHETPLPPTEPTPTPTVTVTASPSPQPTKTVTASPAPGRDLYETPGFHRSADRDWMTVCEAYSSKVDRCWTYIWATTVQESGGRFYQSNGWAFNNLTYVGGTRADWASNPLGHSGTWTASDGRAWRTECDTPTTGRNGCRSYATASLIERNGNAFGWVTKEVLNNQVRFR